MKYGKYIKRAREPFYPLANALGECVRSLNELNRKEVELQKRSITKEETKPVEENLKKSFLQTLKKCWLKIF